MALRVKFGLDRIRNRSSLLRKMSKPKNDHRSEESISILCAIMRMIPAGAIRIGEETVRERRSRSNRALAHRRNAIEPRPHRTPRDIVVRFLQHTMPVNGCALFMQDSALLFRSRFDLVMNNNLKGVSPISCESRPGKASVNQDQAFVETIGLQVPSADVEFVALSVIGKRWVFAVRVGRRCDSLVLRQTTRYAIVLYERQKCSNEGFFIVSDMLTVFGCTRKRGRVGALEVPSVESPESISYLCCFKVE